VGTLAVQLAGERAAYAAGGAGHDDDLTCQRSDRGVFAMVCVLLLGSRARNAE